MQSPGASSKDACQGLEPNSHHKQCYHKLLLRRGPNGMRPLELLADMQVRHQLQCHHKLLAGAPMACSPLELLAKMHVKDWSQRVTTYSTTINLFEEGVPMACSPLELLAKMHVKDWSQTSSLTFVGKRSHMKLSHFAVCCFILFNQKPSFRRYVFGRVGMGTTNLLRFKTEVLVGLF